MEEYARRMASSRCDGDHITLQALCDALKVSLDLARKDWRGGSGDRGVDWTGLLDTLRVLWCSRVCDLNGIVAVCYRGVGNAVCRGGASMV